MRNKRISDKFHTYYEDNRLWENTTWLGVPSWKLPFDAWIIQELIWKVKPDLIIETGTGKAGSAVFYSSIMYCMGINGYVVTVDVERADRQLLQEIPFHLYRKIAFYTGDSTDPDIVKEIKNSWVAAARRVIVLLDSWHSEEHVLKELEMYSDFVTVGSYLVVEDTHVGPPPGNPVIWKYAGGPGSAVKKFLEKSDNFCVDESCEKLVFTFNPGGYLRRFK